MTQYDTLNVKLSNSQLKKLKLRIKNGTVTTLDFLSNVVRNYNNQNYFPLIDKLWGFVKPPQIIYQLIQNYQKISCIKYDNQENFSQALGPFLKNGLFLMKKLLQPLFKSVLIPLGLAASPTDAAILFLEHAWVH